MHRLKEKVILAARPAIFLLFYVSASYLVFHSNSMIEQVQRNSITNNSLERSVQHANFYDAAYFREAASKLQFAKHNPNVVKRAFQLAAMRSPGNYANLLEYGVYAASKNCCRHQAPDLLREAVKRKRQDPRIYKIAGSALLEAGANKQAFSYFRHAILIDSSLAREIYEIMNRRGGSLHDFIRITPKQSGALISLTSFLAFKAKRTPRDLEPLWQEFGRLPMNPGQRISVARNALRTGNYKWARIHANQAMQNPATRPDALKLLADISLKEGNWEEFERVIETVEEFYKKAHGEEKAAAFALESVRKLLPAGRGKTLERMKQILDDYPNYAPAYLEMAKLYERSEPESVLPYLRKAVRLEPDNFEYNSRLAKHYLEMSMIREAEEIYQRFSNRPEFSEAAHLGLASCKQRTGDFYQAIFVLREGLRTSGKSASLFDQLGRSYEAIGEYRKAAEAYREFATLIPKKSTGYLLAAQMYEKAGEFEDAEKEYQEVLKVDPKNSQARRALSALGIATRN